MCEAPEPPAPPLPPLPGTPGRRSTPVMSTAGGASTAGAAGCILLTRLPHARLTQEVCVNKGHCNDDWAARACTAPIAPSPAIAAWPAVAWEWTKVRWKDGNNIQLSTPPSCMCSPPSVALEYLEASLPSLPGHPLPPLPPAPYAL